MNVPQALAMIEGQVELDPQAKSLIEMALNALYQEAYDEGYGEAEYLAKC